MSKTRLITIIMNLRNNVLYINCINAILTLLYSVVYTSVVYTVLLHVICIYVIYVNIFKYHVYYTYIIYLHNE